jgi:hypothetical protein
MELGPGPELFGLMEAASNEEVCAKAQPASNSREHIRFMPVYYAERGGEVHAKPPLVPADSQINRNRDHENHRCHGGCEQAVALNQRHCVGNERS